MVNLGSTLTFSVKLWDRDPSEPGAVLVNPTAATLTIVLNGVTVLTPTITLPPSSTGILTYNYPANVAGRYTGSWQFTMADTSTAAHVQVFNVESADPGYLISLRQAKRHLNIPLDDTDDDEEILEWLAAITPIVEDRIGACLPRTVAEYQEGGQRVIRLGQYPVMSITSIAPYLTAGTTYAINQIRFTPEGRVMLLANTPFADLGPYEITYQVGRNPLPPNVVAAVKIILAHLWETQRGAAGLPLQGGDDLTQISGSGFAVPNRALELLDPNEDGPGVG